MATKAKVTFSIQRALLEAIDVAVAQGVAPSKNALVEHAIQQELRKLRQRTLAEQWAQAAKDATFLREVQEVQASFSAADTEAAELLR